MQAENLSCAVIIWLAWVWVTGLATASEWHSFEARWYEGELGFAVKPPLDPACMVWPPAGGGGGWAGSGKSGTPWARMHFANASMLGLVGVLVLRFGFPLAVGGWVSLFAVAEATFVLAVYGELLLRAAGPEALAPQPATNADAITTANDELRPLVCRFERRASAAAGVLARLITRIAGRLL